MATTTSGNLKLTKPTYSESADIGVINTNMDTIDAAVTGLDGALAIVATGTTAPQAISSGQFVLWRNALYKASTAIASGATLSSSNLTAVSGGGLNALNSSLTNVSSDITAYRLRCHQATINMADCTFEQKGTWYRANIPLGNYINYAVLFAQIVFWTGTATPIIAQLDSSNIQLISPIAPTGGQVVVNIFYWYNSSLI